MTGTWSVALEVASADYDTKVWTVEEAPKGKNDGGLVVYLVHSDTVAGVAKEVEKREVARVAFQRRTSANPRLSFKKALRQQLGVAADAAQALNDTHAAVQEAKANVTKAEEEAASKKLTTLAGATPGKLT